MRIIKTLLVSICFLQVVSGCATSAFIKTEEQLNQVNFENNGLVVGQFKKVYKNNLSSVDLMEDYTFKFERIDGFGDKLNEAIISPFTNEQGYILFSLPVGNYKGKYFYNNESSKYYRSLSRYPFKIEFQVKANTITNLGHLVIVQDPSNDKYFIANIDNIEEIKAFLEDKNIPNLDFANTKNLHASATLNKKKFAFNNYISFLQRLFPEELEKTQQ